VPRFLYSWKWAKDAGLSEREESTGVGNRSAPCSAESCRGATYSSTSARAVPTVTASDMHGLVSSWLSGSRIYAIAGAPLVPWVLLDVRPQLQFGICAVHGSHNVPLAEMLADEDAAVALVEKHRCSAVADALGRGSAGTGSGHIRPSQAECAVMVLCRRGVDSSTATEVSFRGLSRPPTHTHTHTHTRTHVRTLTRMCMSFHPLHPPAHRSHTYRSCCDEAFWLIM
jgi:rhodanese-related sulfurtransferase